MKSAAIIGAGLAGLTLATKLQGKAAVTVFEKSLGYGGRMATRCTESFQFDHGAQYFTARSKEFRQFLLEHCHQDSLQDWQPRTVTLDTTEKPYTRPWFEPHWIGVPGMSSIGGVLARGQHIELQAEVKRLMPAASGWLVELQSGKQFGPFDWIISTAPAPQSSALLPAEFLHHEALSKARLSACFSLMLGFGDDLRLPFQAARAKNSPVGWLAIDSNKPGRLSNNSLLIQSTNNWADNNLQNSLEQVQKLLLEALQRLLPQLPEPEHVAIHRWRYAAVISPVGRDYLLDEKHRLASCGDWCLGSRVEAAFTSAHRLAAALTRHL